MPEEFRVLSQPVIIATKGLPCTGKSEIARLIGQWAKCPVLYIDHFLDAVSLATGYSAELFPSPEQGECLHRLAFDALCKAASDSLQWGVDIGQSILNYKCIVVKSCLCSTFEVDRLLQLAKGCGCGTILIIEFRMENEYRSRLRLENKVKLRGNKQEWYKPRSWKDVEKAKDDNDAHNWDLHLFRLLDNYGDGLPRVTRLVLDPFDHLFLVPFPGISSRCTININFLLGGGMVEIGRYLREENIGNIFVAGRYAVVQFGEVVRYLREKNLRSPRTRRGLCYIGNKNCCVFKYWEKHEDKDESNPDHCGVCEKHVISGQQPAYGCLNCTITLHKPCAERADIVTLEGYQDLNQQLRDYPTRLPLMKHACKSCLEVGKHFSHGCHSCYFQTHLKHGVLPTILNHDCHHHFFFMCFDNVYKCEACGIDRRQFGGCYCCYICDKSYDIECLSLVRQGEHEHGGHQHLLKLIYTREGMEEDESYWCDICYADINP